MSKVKTLDEEDEEMSKLSRSSYSKSNLSMSRNTSNDGSDSENPQFRTFKRHASGDSEEDLEFQPAGNKFKWPDGVIKKILFTIFLPTHFIYWLLMPEIKSKPDISKVMLCSILIFLFSIGFSYLIFRLEVYILLASNMKMEFFGLMNGLYFGIM